MQKEDILRSWRLGLNKFQVANEYMREHNRRAKSNKEIKKITKYEALTIVEPIIFDYEVGGMREAKDVNKQ